MPLSDQTRAMLGLGGGPDKTATPAPRPSGLSPQTRSILGIGAPKPAPTAPIKEDNDSWVEKYAPTIARIGLPIAGGVIGSLVPVAGTTAGAAVGAALGGAIGGGLGEAAAEKLEGRDLDAKEIALSAGLSAIPAGPAGRVAGRLATEAAKTGVSNIGKRAALHAAEGAAQGALAETVSPFVREGRAPTLEEVGRGAAFGTVLGGTLGTGLDVIGNSGRRVPADVPPVEAPVIEAPPVDVAPPPVQIDAPPVRPEIDPPLVAQEPLDAGIDFRETVVEPPPVDLPLPAPQDRPLVAQQALEEPGVAFAEETPIFQNRRVEPRADRRRSELDDIIKNYHPDQLREEHPATWEVVYQDSLTGLGNRRAYERLIDEHKGPVVSMDLHGLGYVNDFLGGHETGNSFLKAFGQAASEEPGVRVLRAGERADEFVILAESDEIADQAAARIQDRFSRSVFSGKKDGKPVSYTGGRVDYGIGPASSAETGAERFAVADAALYQNREFAKQAGLRATAKGQRPPGISEVPGPGNLADPTAPPVELPQPVPPRFNREAALQRLYSRGTQANDLGSAAAQGAGVLRDLAEIGASYVEEYAQRNKGKIVEFDSWARAAYKALRDVVPNVRQYLRKIYDEAVGLWNKTGITFGELPNEPRGVVLGSLGGALQPPGPPKMPPPKMPKAEPVADVPTSPRPLPPGTIVNRTEPVADPVADVRTQVTGRPMEPGEAPRVESRVEDLRVAEKEAGQPPAELDRDTKQRWKDLDPQAQKILREYDDDRFFNVMKQRNLDAAETMAWDARIRGKAERADELRARIRENPNDDVAKRDLVAADLDFIAAQRANVNDGTGLARALAARARVMDASRQPDDQFLKKVFRELPNVSDKQASELVQAFRENPDNLQPLLHAAVGHGKLQKALELWKANMLSAFSTDIANFSGNAIEHHMQLAQTATSSLVDAVLQKLYGGNRARFAGEFGAEWAGGNQAFAPALKNLGRNLMDTVVKGKRKPIDLSRRLEYQTSALDPKGLGQYTSRVFGKLEVADQFFKEWGGAAELGKLAYRKAAKGGGSPEQIQKRAAEIMQQIADPANAEHADLIRAVATAKESRTFQEARADSLTESVQQFVRRHPLMQVVVPFVRTPGNIAARIIERSPLGAKRAMQAFNAFKEARVKFEAGELSADDFAEARGKLADAISGPLMGTALLSGFAGIAQAGGMTGGGPTDPKDRNALRDSGWSPYSFVFTNPATGKKTYVPFNRFEPVSSLMGFAADMVEAKDAKSSGDLFDKALGSLVSNLSSKSYLQGLSETAALLSNPKQFASEYVRGQAGSLVPNIIGRAASAVDPTFRDTRPESEGPTGIVEAAGKTIVSRIPGASMLLPERRSGTGEPIERQGSALSRFLAPAPPSTEKEGGDFQKLLVDIDAVPSAPGRDIAVSGKRVRLTEAEYKAIQDADAKVTAELRRRLPALRKADPEKARNVIRSAYDQARSKVRKKVMASPEFRARFREVSK